MIDNVWPAPPGPNATFSNLVPGKDTPNFVFSEQGHYMVTWEAVDPNNPGTLLLQTQSASGTDTTVLTMNRQGAYDYVIASNGPVTFNFNASLGARRATLTQCKGGVL